VDPERVHTCCSIRPIVKGCTDCSSSFRETLYLSVPLCCRKKLLDDTDSFCTGILLGTEIVHLLVDSEKSSYNAWNGKYKIR
jgi:hypothetical protein